MRSERDRRLAILAVDHHFLSRAQVDDCLRRVDTVGASLEQVLLERGFLSPVEVHELGRLVSAPPRFAEIVRERGLASDSEVFDALRLKAQLASVDVHRPVGRILVERAVLSETQVDDILAEQSRRTPERQHGYRLGAELGRSPLAVAHRAVDTANGRDVVFKRVFGAAAALPRVIRAKRVDHPNLARVLDAGTEGADLWIASEYVEGLPLYDHVVGTFRLPLEEATATMKQIAAGLGACHAAGLPHGRVTPRNVLLTEMREARITDLALRSGDAAADLRACAPLWAFMLRGEEALASPPRFAPEHPRLAVAIYARLAGAG
ncbi:MAG TPA: protein kinase, partial [Planctomycetota bacterium]